MVHLSDSGRADATIHLLRDCLRGDDAAAGRGGRTFLAVRDVVFGRVRHRLVAAIESYCVRRVFHDQE